MTNTEYPLTSTTGKHYRIIQGEDGRELWEYESGIIRDPVAKHNLAFGPDHGIKSSEQAKEMQAIGQEAIRRDILNGYRKAIQAKTGKTVETDAAVREVFGQAVMEHALASPYTPGSVHAKRLAAELADLMPDKRRGTEELAPGQVRLSLTGSVRDLRQAMAGRYSAHASDAVVIDADSSEPASGSPGDGE